MARFRLYPSVGQVSVLVKHCAHARFVWNVALEQQLWYGRAGRKTWPGWAEQNRQLTEARAAVQWLAEGSVTVQQQALRDAHQAWRNFFGGSHRRPTWRKAGRNEGFRIVGRQALRVRRINRRWGDVNIPKVGWVRFRYSRKTGGAKSYRVTCDRSGRWHIAFAAIPAPIPFPDSGQSVGIDCGIAISYALSTGTMLHVPGLLPMEAKRLARLKRRLGRAARGSKRRLRLKTDIARLRARETDRRKDFIEQATTDLARRFDKIRIEDLSIRNMLRSAKGTPERPGANVAQKAGLNRRIAQQGWGLFASRLEQKAPGRIERIPPRYTSQRCSRCGYTAPENRESQAVFRCGACNVRMNADFNAAINIAAGHAVPARGGHGMPQPTNREPQHASSGSRSWNPSLEPREDVNWPD